MNFILVFYRRIKILVDSLITGVKHHRFRLIGNFEKHGSPRGCEGFYQTIVAAAFTGRIAPMATSKCATCGQVKMLHLGRQLELIY
jgi:hypothetical protein